MEKVRCGVIGLGIGRAHLKGYQSHPMAEVVAVADPDESRLKSVGDEFHVPERYTSATEMFRKAKLDVVSVATPNKFHMPLSLEALKAGCHVICEKPMAMSAREGRVMAEAARKAGKRLMINFSYRFRDETMALKKEVDGGALGDVYMARTIWHRRRGMPRFGGWFGQKELAGGGPLIDLGVHRIDLALWLMGYPKPAWVMGNAYGAIAPALAKREGKKFDVEDMAVAMVSFENGATLWVEASWAANVAEAEMMETRLFGTEGGCVHRNVNETYQFEVDLFLPRPGGHFDMKLRRPEPGLGSSMHHMVDCILNDKPHIATAEEGILVMELLDAIYKSAAQKKPVKLGGK